MTAPVKRGPGRPPLSDGEETRVLYVRLPESEYDAVIAQAEHGGERASEYARRALVAQAKRDARRAG